MFKDTSDRIPHPGPPAAPETPWWRVCDLAEFERRVQAMSDVEFSELAARIRAAAKAFAVQLQGSRDDDPAWRRRAKMAFSYMVEKKALIANEEHRRHQAKNKTSQEVRTERRRALLKAATELNEAGDVAGAIRMLIQFLDPKSPENAP
jgi:hypothetical protein